MGKALIGCVKRWLANMRISILCTDQNHPVVRRLQEWDADMTKEGHSITVIYDKALLAGGDILFLVSCSQIIGVEERNKYKATMVLHASDLPRGRGWSPYIWEVLNGENQLTVSLLEASEPIDSGAVCLKTSFLLEGHELLTEINEKVFDAELYLMTQMVERFDNIKSTPQAGEPGSYMRKRTPADSRLDPDKSIAEQFDLLRVVDSQRYPAFFDYRGKRYLIKIEKDNYEQ